MLVTIVLTVDSRDNHEVIGNSRGDMGHLYFTFKNILNEFFQIFDGIYLEVVFILGADYIEDMSYILKVRRRKYLDIKRIKFTIYMFPIQSSTYLYMEDWGTSTPTRSSLTICPALNPDLLHT